MTCDDRRHLYILEVNSFLYLGSDETIESNGNVHHLWCTYSQLSPIGHTANYPPEIFSLLLNLISEPGLFVFQGSLRPRSSRELSSQAKKPSHSHSNGGTDYVQKWGSLS